MNNTKKYIEIYRDMQVIGRRFKEILFKSQNMSMQHGLVLLELYIGGKFTVNDLAKSLAMRQPNVSSVAKEMQRKGLVKRVMDEEDNRVTHISLDEKGYEVIDKIFLELKEVIKQMETELSTSSKDIIAKTGNFTKALLSVLEE